VRNKRLKRMKKSLTARQRALIKNLTKGMSVSEAALKAGYTDKAPNQAGHQALEQVRAKMPELLDAKGLTDDALIDKYLRPGLEATETEFAKYEGKITDSCDVVAWGPRKEFLDMTFRLKGSYAPVRQAVSAENGPLAVQIITNVKLPHDLGCACASCEKRDVSRPAS
jgi:hypothetical protein